MYKQLQNTNLMLPDLHLNVLICTFAAHYMNNNQK